MCYCYDDDELVVKNFIKKHPVCECANCGEVHKSVDMNIDCVPGADVVLVLCKKCNNEYQEKKDNKKEYFAKLLNFISDVWLYTVTTVEVLCALRKKPNK